MTQLFAFAKWNVVQKKPRGTALYLIQVSHLLAHAYPCTPNWDKIQEPFFSI